MYGLYPSAEVNRQAIQLQPVLSLKSQIVHVKEVPAGWGISYGTRYVAGEPTRIGTIPIGYADGYSRLLSGKAQGLLRGRRVPIVGTICMDQCMVELGAADALGAGPVMPGEEIVLIGSQGSESISADEVACSAGYDQLRADLHAGCSGAAHLYARRSRCRGVESAGGWIGMMTLYDFPPNHDFCPLYACHFLRESEQELRRYAANIQITIQTFR